MRRHSFSGPSRTLIENTEVETNILNRLISRRNNNTIHLEEEIYINRDLEIYRNNEINLLNPRRLYNVGILQS